MLPPTNQAKDAENGGGKDHEEVDEGQQDHGNGDVADPAEVFPLEQHLLDGPTHLGTGYHTPSLEPGSVPSRCSPAGPHHPYSSPIPIALQVTITPFPSQALTLMPHWSLSPFHSLVPVALLLPHHPLPLP